MRLLLLVLLRFLCYAPLVVEVLALLVRMALVLTPPGQVEILTPASVQRYKQVRAKVSVANINLRPYKFLLRRHSLAIRHSLRQQRLHPKRQFAIRPQALLLQWWRSFVLTFVATMAGGAVSMLGEDQIRHSLRSHHPQSTFRVVLSIGKPASAVVAC